jgi:hypothetical protein
MGRALGSLPHRQILEYYIKPWRMPGPLVHAYETIRQALSPFLGNSSKWRIPMGAACFVSNLDKNPTLSMYGTLMESIRLPAEPGEEGRDKSSRLLRARS